MSLLKLAGANGALLGLFTLAAGARLDASLPVTGNLGGDAWSVGL